MSDPTERANKLCSKAGSVKEALRNYGFIGNPVHFLSCKQTYRCVIGQAVSPEAIVKDRSSTEVQLS
jgi:hypothetical protein